MKEQAMLAGDAADLRDGLDGAHLVVGVHDADQEGLRGDGPPNLLGIDQASAVAPT